ncbi:MAG: ATP synthase F1 subunit gamma [Bacteroidales bacterium]|nr:ATP synthase F1 subunit gamma [Bacteroidales bacterium]
MASLKEIRGRIGSVRQTLKITSAMRLISSAKLHSAQNAISNMLAYEQSLRSVYDRLSGCEGASEVVKPFAAGTGERTAVVLVTSNRALCGGFNAGLAKTFEEQDFDIGTTTVYAIGKFGYKAVRKLGFEAENLCAMAEKADYAASAALAEKLVSQFLDGKLSRVVLIYSHFASMSNVPVKVETYLPMVPGESSGEPCGTDYIVEPSPVEVLEHLLPKVLKLSLHTVLLDAQAAEHAARSLAMQMATDNGNNLLAELSLQYNKLRQQAITNEILDLVGGQINH